VPADANRAQPAEPAGSGLFVEEGGPELAHKLEAEGYEAFTPEVVK